MFQEFKEFISRGSVLDLAVAVIIGAAFGAIVNSLVADIITPVIGVALGGVDFSSLAIQVGEASVTYGNFIQAIINFLVIAFVIFLIVRGINQAQSAQEEEAVVESDEPPAPPAEELLLTEIRDLLRGR